MVNDMGKEPEGTAPRIIREGVKTYCVGSSDYSDYFYSVEYETIRNNRIPVLLPLQVRQMDNTTEVYYDITGKRSLEDLAREQAFSFSQCRNITDSLILMMQDLEEYLLEPDYINFKPAYIFTNGRKLQWAYGMPCEKSLQEELEDFLSFLLAKVNYDDAKAVRYVYEIFWLVRKQGFSVELIKGLQPDDYESEHGGDNKGDRYDSFFEDRISSERNSDKGDQKDIGPDVPKEKESTAKQPASVFRPVIMILLFLTAAGSLTGLGLLFFFGYQKGYTLRGKYALVLCAGLFAASAGLWVRVLRKTFFSPSNDKVMKDAAPACAQDFPEETEQSAPGQNERPERFGQLERFERLGQPEQPDYSKHFEAPVGTAEFPFLSYEEEENAKGEYNLFADELKEPAGTLDHRPEAIGQYGGMNYDSPSDEGTIILSKISRNYPILKSLDTGNLTPVRDFPFYIGSDPILNRMVLIDKTISKQHAVILQGKKNTYRIKDLGSTNGTWIKGVQVNSARPEMLEDGCIICFARKQYRFIINRDHY